MQGGDGEGAADLFDGVDGGVDGHGVAEDDGAERLPPGERRRQLVPEQQHAKCATVFP